MVLRVTGRTKVCAVIGDPIEHSLSPLMHNAAFEALGLDYAYVAFRVRAEELARAVEGMRALGVVGFNVTIPHKVSIIPMLDELDPLAESIGAVNTVVNRSGRLVGYNTDAEGAAKALEEAGFDVRGAKVVMVGAGGAARAIAHRLAPMAREFVILNRTKSRAELEAELRDADLLINATPIGMWPNVDESPVDADLIRPGMAVFDAVYNPIETKLLKYAKAKGAKAIDGVSMFVHQGAEAFRLWTGAEPPIGVMRRAVEAELRKG